MMVDKCSCILGPVRNRHEIETSIGIPPLSHSNLLGPEENSAILDSLETYFADRFKATLIEGASGNC